MLFRSNKTTNFERDLRAVVASLGVRAPFTATVLRDGKVVERGPAQQVFSQPQTPYTKALIAAAFNLESVA